MRAEAEGERVFGGSGRERDAEFVAFVSDAQLRLRRVAYAMCGDWHRAEDVVQAALTNLYLHWTRVERETGAWSYARRAVVNAAIDESRRTWRRETATETVPERAARAAELSIDDALLAALSALPTRQRAVVVLRYVEDLEVEVVAHLLGISEGTVKSQAARGLATLRSGMDRTQERVR